jgi:hypothetical protein
MYLILFPILEPTHNPYATKLTQPRREKQWQKLSKGWVKVNTDVAFDEVTSTGNPIFLPFSLCFEKNSHLAPSKT